MTKNRSAAIVGIGSIFPDAPDPETFWKNIVTSLNSSRRVPAHRWAIDRDTAFDKKAGLPDKVYSKKACLIDEDLARLDTKGLDISPELADNLDPLFRLLLIAGKQAFDDAGCADWDTSNTGVIIGNLVLPTDTASTLSEESVMRTFTEQGNLDWQAKQTTDPRNRYSAGMPSGILSKALGLGGDSFTLDAACASSLYAVKLAIDELFAGNADAMLCGGVARADSLYTQMGFSQLRALSPTGTSAPFDHKGNGLVVGEGAGIFVIKRLEDAEADGDKVYAVIRGVGLSNDMEGRLLAPTSEGQLRAMHAAYEQAGWKPSDVDMVECHATGTPVGDVVEFESLRSLWKDAENPQPCIIGSVKSNIGHLLTAAGAAAMTKVILALKHKTLPPTANFTKPPAKVNMDETPFRVLTESIPWDKRDSAATRKAAVSAFGFGGINAHVLIEEYRRPESPKKDKITLQPEPMRIAVVGMDTQFGQWDSLRAFQHRVLAGEDIPLQTSDTWWGSEHTDWFRHTYSKELNRGYMIDSVTSERDYFRIPPKELEEMLPQQLLMLQVAAHAWNDAGLGSQGNTGSGVFVGIGLDMNTTNFHLRWVLANMTPEWIKKLNASCTPEEAEEWLANLRDAIGPPLTPNRTMGGLGSVIASRIARELRFGGPSFTVSSEETSGIHALKTAIMSLQTGSIDTALVGAVDMAGDIRAVLAAEALRGTSASGRIRPFDPDADGTIIGEGAAALVLKRLDDAIADEDRIYAVIKGIGTATGGKTDETVPDSPAYLNALNRAYTAADFDRHTIEYIETNGSGVPEEDYNELSALLEFFKETDVPEDRDDPAVCALGSVKKHIGHAGCASALASTVKTCLCLYNEILPPLNANGTIRQELETDDCHLYLPRNPSYWLHNRADGPRRAGVSSMSVSGTCAHVAMEAFENKRSRMMGTVLEPEKLQPLGSGAEGLFCITAENPQLLADGIDRLHAFAEKAVSYTIDEAACLWWKDSAFSISVEYAISFAARSRDELLKQTAYAAEEIRKNPKKRIDPQTGSLPYAHINDRIFYNPKPIFRNNKNRTIAFVFPGSGNQFPDMGRDVFLRWPEVLRKQYDENKYLKSQYRPDRFWYLGFRGSDPYEITEDHKAMIFGQVALGTGMSDLMRYLGVRPQAGIGYSLGETASLFSLGAWTDRDIMLERMRLSTLFTRDLAGEFEAARKNWKLSQHEAVDWVLGVIDRPINTLKSAVKNRKEAYALISNTLKECVIGGKRIVVESIVKRLGCQYIPIKGVTLAHCDILKEVEKPYRDLHLLETTPPLDITFYSGSWGQAYTPTSETAADSILAHAIHGIDFPKTIRAAYDNGVRVFLEMGPGSSCTRMISDILAKKDHLARAVCVQNQDPVSLVLRTLGNLIAERADLDLEMLYGTAQSLPSREIHSRSGRPDPVTVQIGGVGFHIPLPVHREPEPVQDIPEPEKPQPAPIVKTSPPAAPVSVEITTKPQMQPLPAAQPVPLSAPAGTDAGLLEQINRTEQARLEAHRKYLEFSNTLTNTMTALMSGTVPAQAVPIEYTTAAPAAPAVHTDIHPPTALNEAQCMEFAIGSIEKVFGPQYAGIDAHPTRVRLPDDPLMLVHRVTAFEGEPCSMGQGRIVTEHDVKADDWYLDCGRMPICITVESGQADLMLSGYLGIDHKTRGLAVYRLLDADITFHRHLPVPGETVRYDIRINRFFIHNDTWFFNFEYDGTINGIPLLTMRNGCAGFFTQAALDAGKGLTKTKLNTAAIPGKRDPQWNELVPMQKETYTEDQLNALRQGDLAACFGPEFNNLDLQNPLTLPGGRMKLIDRVTELDPTGGRFGLGSLTAEADIHPDDWFLTCHFVDDMVMPGTLMYECCMHTFRVFLLRMGWVGEADVVSVEPVQDVTSRLKCRGQVIQSTKTVAYEIAVKEIGYGPEPYAIADARMYADGKYVVDMENMSCRLSGLTKEQLEQLWNNQTTPYYAEPGVPVYDNEQIMAFCVGNPSEGFGDPYKPFDKERKIARLPRPPYKFLDRVTAVSGEPWVMQPGATARAQYDFTADEWYFDADRQNEMPFAVLLEVALQPCGWLAAYVGSALASDTDLRFRNLGGSAVQHRSVNRNSRMITTDAKLLTVSHSGGMIIQQFDFKLYDTEGLIYEGNTDFGFFSKEALANQVGIQEARLYEMSAEEKAAAETFAYPAEAPFPDTMMRMNDTIDAYVPDGGKHGLGYIRSLKTVNPEEWFFKAHFYQDPVNPGSLGLEAFIQIMKAAAAKRWALNKNTVWHVNRDSKHTWLYRGQVIPDNKEVTVEAHITSVDDKARLLKAEGYLSVDGRIIYQMIDFSLKAE